MVMKDKLYKSNHKGGYYRTRKLLIASAVILSGITCVSVPTYINYKNDSKVKAETEIKVETPETEEIIITGTFERIDEGVDKFTCGSESGDSHFEFTYIEK